MDATRFETTDDRVGPTLIVDPERLSAPPPSSVNQPGLPGDLLDRARIGQDVDGHARDVLAMVTHDLRGPLTAIAANAQCIAEESREASIREMADDVVRAAARMEHLLLSLLDAARIGSSVAHAQGVDGQDGDVLAMVAHDLRGFLTVIAVNIQCISEDSQEPSIRETADDVVLAAARIEHFLPTLLNAACTATPKTSTRLR